VKRSISVPLRAAILAGGEGHRISPHFDYVPKLFLPIQRLPLIEYQLRILEKCNFDEVYIIVREEPKWIEEEIKKIKVNLSVNIVRKNTTGTFDGLFALKSFLKRGNDFFLFNVDNTFSPSDFMSFVESRRGITEPEIVVWVHKNTYRDKLPVGVKILESGQIADYGKEVSSDYVAIGPKHCQISILDAEYKDKASLNNITRLSDYFGFLLHNGITIKSFLVKNEILDIDTPDDLNYANNNFDTFFT
jgi:NDP-sugar pyrophosphorylase family protein